MILVIFQNNLFFDTGTGKLGRINMQEVGMHMYLPHCDIYDPDNPEELICEGDQLDEFNHLQVTLEPEPRGGGLKNPFDATEACFGELSDFIKEAINRARNR